MLVADRIGAEVLGYLPEEQLPLERATGARHTGRGVDHDLARRIDQARPAEREQGEQRGGGVTAGVGHELGGGDPGAGHLGQPIDGLGREPEIGRQVHGALAQRARFLHVLRRYAVWQGGKHHLRRRDGRVGDPQELHALLPLARRRFRGAERDGRTGVAGQEPQQLLADVPGGAQDAHRHRCINIHRSGKIFTLARSARAG